MGSGQSVDQLCRVLGGNESCKCFRGMSGLSFSENAIQGGESYQQAYYVYEELAQATATTSATSLVGQAISELHLSRLPEAEVVLQQALEKYPENPHALANSIVLHHLLGKDSDEILQ